MLLEKTLSNLFCVTYPVGLSGSLSSLKFDNVRICLFFRVSDMMDEIEIRLLLLKNQQIARYSFVRGLNSTLAGLKGISETYLI